MEAAATTADAGIELADSVRRKLFVVIAAYNEAAVIGKVVRELRVVYPNVVVVDDGSADDTWRSARDGGATVLRHTLNRGQGAALQTGKSRSAWARASSTTPTRSRSAGACCWQARSPSRG